MACEYLDETKENSCRMVSALCPDGYVCCKLACDDWYGRMGIPRFKKKEPEGELLAKKKEEQDA